MWTKNTFRKVSQNWTFFFFGDGFFKVNLAEAGLRVEYLLSFKKMKIECVRVLSQLLVAEVTDLPTAKHATDKEAWF